MERLVIHRNNQEMQSADLNNGQLFARQALDNIVGDTIEDGRAYSGFAVSKTGTAEITVDPGRLYVEGAVYAREDNVVIDLLNVTPLVTKKRVAIVAWGQSVETDVQPRDFLINADTGATEPQNVAMITARRAEINAVAGQEAADPAYPTTDANNTVLAYVLMDTTGVISIEPYTVSRVNNLRAVAGRTTELEGWKQLIAGRVDTLASDLASINLKLPTFASDAAMNELARRMLELEKKANTPAAYLSHTVNQMIDDSDANAAFSGYDCTIDQGLRFPASASSVVTLSLLNPNDPFIIGYTGVFLPVHVHSLRHDCRGYHRQHRCGQYDFHTHSVDILAFSRMLLRNGPDFFGSLRAEFLTRSLDDALKTVLYRNSGTWNDITFKQYMDAADDIWRRQSFVMRLGYSKGQWENFCEAFYWAHIKTSVSIAAYHLSQTFLAAQDMWLTKVGVYFSQLDVTGDVDVLVCETLGNGQPDLERVLSRTTVTRANIAIGTGSGGAGLPSVVETVVTLTPTAIKAGQRYAVVLAVKGDHWLACSDSDFPVLQGACWAFQSNAWVQLPGVFKMRLYGAQWDNGRIVVNMTPLQLAGGIRALEFHGEMVQPGQAKIVYEVQVGGTWYPVNGSLDLSSLPAILPVRAVFMGTRDLHACVKLATVKVTCKRSKTVLKYASKTRALGSNASKIVIDAYLEGFNDSVHDCTCTVKTNAGGTTEAADTVADTDLGNGITKRTWTFNIVADNDYFYVIDGTLTSIDAPFVVTQVEDIATA